MMSCAYDKRRRPSGQQNNTPAGQGLPVPPAVSAAPPSGAHLERRADKLRTGRA